MLKIFLIIYIFKCAVADDESYEKYIDMLPDEEKRDVLDRIARRILEDITTDNVPNESQIEITDEQLQVHDAYVKDILKEEADRLKSKKKIEDKKGTDEPGNDRDGENRHIDLTLRSGKRSKRKNVDQDIQLETTSEVAYNVIPVKTVYDRENGPDEATIGESNEMLSTLSTKQNENFTSDDTKNDSDSSLLSVQEKLIPQSSNNNLRKAFQSVNQDSTVSMDLDEKFDNNSSVKEDSDANSETIVPLSEENMDNNTIEGSKIDKLNANEKGDLDEEVRTDATPAVLYNISSTVSTQATASNEKINTNEFETVTVQQMEQGTSRIVNQPFQRKGGLDINENISHIVDTTISEINDLKHDSPIKLTPSPIDNIKINYTDSDTKSLETTNNTLEPQATFGSLNSTTVRKSDNIESINVINEENTSSEKVLDPIVSLRSGSDDINESESKEDNVLLQTDKKISELGREYEVYEVAAEKPPFTLSSNMNRNEQPRYVPVYDYAPEKAYFRPYDRFGSNDEDIEHVQNYDNIIQKRSRFSSYNTNDKRQFNMQTNYYPNNNGNSKMYGFMKPVSFGNAIKYYNPYDYFDIDYNNRYNGRSYLRNGKYKTFPGSDEVDHPYNAIHKSNSLKDHVRTIRKLLYLQKMFGYVPDTNKENRKFDQETAIQIKKRKEKFLKKHPSDDIGIDYYYDRTSSKEDLEKAIQGNIKLEGIRNLNAGSNTDNQKHPTDLDGIDKLNESNDITEDDSKFSSFFDTLLSVLEDNIRFNSEALEHYDWLKTSVDIQSAITKLLDLEESLKHGEGIHPNDLELLKYSLYQFKSSKGTLQDSPPKSIGKNGHRRKKKKGILPKSNRNRNRIKQPLKLWKDFATYLRDNFKYDKTEQKLTLLYDFEDFLQNVLFHVKEFHEAIKHVAIITRFNDQNWFHDIKRIFFKKATKKQLGQVILHLSLVNLLDRVEEDAVNGSEVNFRQFVENNPEAVTATKKKFAFVLRVLKELNGLNV